MKVITPDQMIDIESAAYRSGASSAEYMEEAGSGVALVVQDYVEKNEIERIAILLCGKGNNAGDAYVAGMHLLALEYEVFAIQVVPIDECSPLCKQNFERFINNGGQMIITQEELPDRGVIIDGLFGTGFHGTVSGKFYEIIEYANNSGLPVISVDIPSGLNGNTGEVMGLAIVATETAFLGLPKIGFFLRDGWNHVGKLRYIDFGLPEIFFEECDSDFYLLDLQDIQPQMPKIPYNRYKYQAGLVVGVSGSPGMPGAAILSSTAALRGGAGIVRLMYPEGMLAEFAGCMPELIKAAFHYEQPESLVDALNRGAATFIGPGIGVTDQSRDLLRYLLPKLTKPCVIDADGLTILAEDWIDLPEQTILTPHVGEMMRLLQITERPVIDLEFLKTCSRFAEEKNVCLVLKGGVTFIFCDKEMVFINSTGNPGMATAGSGDVLTGLIASMLAQGASIENAAKIGVFLHGLAGEYAAEEMTPSVMIASDILYHFPEAFKFRLL